MLQKGYLYEKFKKIGAILCLYGSFCLIFRPFFSFDKEYLINISETTNIEFPEEYLLVSDSLTLQEKFIKFDGVSYNIVKLTPDNKGVILYD